MWIRLGAVLFGVFCTGIRWAAEWQAEVGNGYHTVCEWSRALCHLRSMVYLFVLGSSVCTWFYSLIPVKTLEPREQSRYVVSFVSSARTVTNPQLPVDSTPLHSFFSLADRGYRLGWPTRPDSYLWLLCTR